MYLNQVSSLITAITMMIQHTQYKTVWILTHKSPWWSSFDFTPWKLFFFFIKYEKQIVWNHVCGLSKIFWFANFVGNWFVVLQRQMIHYYVKCSLGRNFVGKGNPRNSRTLIPLAPLNNDDSKVQWENNVLCMVNMVNGKSLKVGDETDITLKKWIDHASTSFNFIQLQTSENIT